MSENTCLPTGNTNTQTFVQVFGDASEEARAAAIAIVERYVIRTVASKFGEAMEVEDPKNTTFVRCTPILSSRVECHLDRRPLGLPWLRMLRSGAHLTTAQTDSTTQ